MKRFRRWVFIVVWTILFATTMALWVRSWYVADSFGWVTISGQEDNTFGVFSSNNRVGLIWSSKHPVGNWKILYGPVQFGSVHVIGGLMNVPYPQTFAYRLGFRYVYYHSLWAMTYSRPWTLDQIGGQIQFPFWLVGICEIAIFAYCLQRHRRSGQARIGFCTNVATTFAPPPTAARNAGRFRRRWRRRLETPPI